MSQKGLFWTLLCEGLSFEVPVEDRRVYPEIGGFGHCLYERVSSARWSCATA